MLNMIAGVAFNNDGAWLGLAVAFFYFLCSSFIALRAFSKNCSLCLEENELYLFFLLRGLEVIVNYFVGHFLI